MSSIEQLGEDSLIESLLQQVPVLQGAAGPGDDCAVIERDNGRLQLLKTDALIEGVHFKSGTDAKAVGWKAAARVISDFAAMGGQPKEFLITIAMPGATDATWALDLYRGIGNCLKQYGGHVAGGETTSCPKGSAIMISISACGEVTPEKLTLRSGGEAGDSLMVTGKLGGSITGKHLAFKPRIKEADWLCRHFKPNAMMDLSDGLAKDLPRLGKASGCGFKLQQDAITCSEGSSLQQALNDGEDYELLFTIDSNRADALLDAWGLEFPDLALSAIGKLCAEGDGDMLSGGWDHFAKS